MTAAQIQAIRKALGENTATFGARFMTSGRTVEGWEQGRAMHPLVQRELATLARLASVTLPATPAKKRRKA